MMDAHLIGAILCILFRLYGVAMTHSHNASSGFSSPPCFAHELGEDCEGFSVVDPQQALDVARWRQSKRRALIEDRASLSVADRERLGKALSDHLLAFISDRFRERKGMTLSFYWPIKAELDVRPAMIDLHKKGFGLALPVIEIKNQPLVFHAWTPGAPMERGFWNIPVPAEKKPVTPDLLLAPLVGWDPTLYRLGYGGGYFDRTLAKFEQKPLAIGVGLRAAKIDTIFPQPHDRSLDAILTEYGLEATSARL